MQAGEPGEWGQRDRLRIAFPEGGGKACQATCPVSKGRGQWGCRRVTSRNARDCLYRWLQPAPFASRSGQGDGGREFREACESAGQALGIARYVLPPRQRRCGPSQRHRRYECSPCSQGR